MLGKTVKIGSIVLVSGVVLGGVLFGTEAFSYGRSAIGQARSAVKDAVPIEFELTRARDLLDQIIPEMHANVRLIAQEEVEIAALSEDIAAQQARIGEETQRIAKMRGMLDSQQTVYVISRQKYDRTQVAEDLGRRLSRIEEAQTTLAAKQKLLESRRQSLLAAQSMLEKTRSEKLRLEDRIEGLESQYRVVQAASVGSKFSLDQSKVAQTEKLLNDIKKRLDVAERVLNHESRFVQDLPIEVEVLNESELLERVDHFLHKQEGTSARDEFAQDPTADSISLR